MICLSFLGVIHKILASYKHAKLYEYLTFVRMWPVAIALNYSVHDIRNDIRQIIYNRQWLENQ